MRDGSALARVLLLALGTAVGSTACSDTSRPTGPEAPPPSRFISDGVHGGGNAHFFWLPPMVGQPPSYNAPFDATLSPTVRICDLADCAGRIIAQFGMNTGAGSEAVRLSAADERYVVNWHTDRFDVAPGPIYRISVRVAGTELGFIDVQIASNGAAAKNLTTSEVIALKDGRTLPVSFRIEEGAVHVVSPETGGTVQALGGAVTLAIPPGALATETGITVKPVQPTGGALTVVEFGPSGLQFQEPVPVTLAYDPGALPPGVSENDLALNIRDAQGRWVVLPGSTVNDVDHTVTAPFHHFSEGGVGPATLASLCSGDADPDTFETIEASLDAVMEAGTVEVCSGPHPAEGVWVRRPVTIMPMQGATPTFTTGTEKYAFIVGGYSAGSVVFDGLTFDMTTPAVDSPVIFGNLSFTIWAGPPGGNDPYDQLIIRNSTFHTAAATRGSLRVNPSNVPGGRVVLENVTITGGDVGIQAVASTLEATDLTIEGVPGSRFALLVSSGAGRAHATFQRSTIRNWDAMCIQVSNNAGVTIQESTLDDCGPIVATGPLANLDLLSNAITNPDLIGVPAVDQNVTVAIVNGANGLIQDNDLTGCGELRCVQVLGTAQILENRISLPTAGAAHAPAFHQVIEVGNGGSAGIIGNEITGCWARCIGASLGAVATISSNTMTIPAGFPTLSAAIFGNGGTNPNAGGLPNPADRATLTVTNNLIEGLGPIANPNDAPSYPILNGINLIHTVASAVSGNTVRRAGFGIVSLEGSDIQDGRDNTLDQVRWGVAVSNYTSQSSTAPGVDDGRATLGFSDITNSVVPILARPGDTASDLTCNFWGGATGEPLNLLDPGPEASIYTPWSATPIAGTGASGCP